MRSKTHRQRLLATALLGTVLWASMAGAVTLEDARKCLAVHQDTMRLACYDAIFERLDAPPPAPSRRTGTPDAPEPSPGVAAGPADDEPASAAQPQTARDDGGFHLPRLWQRRAHGEVADDTYTAVIVARYPLARKRWILRTDGYELFESYEPQDWVPEVGERVTIDRAAVGAGFTVNDARGGARMKRLACDGSSRRKETRRKCELLLGDAR